MAVELVGIETCYRREEERYRRDLSPVLMPPLPPPRRDNSPFGSSGKRVAAAAASRLGFLLDEISQRGLQPRRAANRFTSRITQPSRRLSGNERDKRYRMSARDRINLQARRALLLGWSPSDGSSGGCDWRLRGCLAIR